MEEPEVQSQVIPPERLEVHRLVLEACIDQNITFYWIPVWVILVPLGEVRSLLRHLEDRLVILGLDSFDIDGVNIYARLDYISDYGPGTTVDRALEELETWPTDEGIWVEVTAKLAE